MVVPPQSRLCSSYLWIKRIVQKVLLHISLINSSQLQPLKYCQILIERPLFIIMRPFVHSYNTNKSMLTVKQYNKKQKLPLKKMMEATELKPLTMDLSVEDEHKELTVFMTLAKMWSEAKGLPDHKHYIVILHLLSKEGLHHWESFPLAALKQ